MVKYSAYEWLLIDAANNFGEDKLKFEERIDWAKENMLNLETLANQADKKPLYVKAVMAIRKAQQGIPTGHIVAVDGVCSGLQVMSALTGCTSGADATGLVDPNRRADAYTQVTDAMNVILGGTLKISRDDAKSATMKAFYGSKAVPKALFGIDTPALKAFYKAIGTVSPGACALLDALLASWDSEALEHSWKLPDGFDARVKVMEQKESRIEIDELGGASCTYIYYVNEAKEHGLSNAANLVHSVDGYVLREMHRRCNYMNESIVNVDQIIQCELVYRSMGGEVSQEEPTDTVQYFVNQYKRSSLVSAVILPHISTDAARHLTTEHLQALAGIVNGMLQHKSFPLITIHDSFGSHANNVNQVRFHYKEILAEIADSDLVSDLLSQIYKEKLSVNKLSFNLGDEIRGSSYALC